MAEKKSKTGKTLVWILMGLLILGLGGFGATSFSGSARSVGAVGQAEISINDYFRAVQNEMRALQSQTGQPLSFQQAQLMGVTDRVLAQLVVTAALEDEAKTLGISVGDEQLAEDLRNIRAFQGADGQFNRETYRLTLENANLSESEFEQDLRNESAATILQGAVLAGVALPDTYIDTLVAYAGERRSFSWAEVADLTTGLPVASEDDLKAFYEENIAVYTRPQTKQITFAWLTPEMILDTVEVDQDTLRAAYEEREAEFNLPERRLVERLVFADDASAQAAADRVASGEASFEDLVRERDLLLTDTDLGDVTRQDLGDAADQVFAAETGAVVGPAPSDLGAALFRVNAVLDAQSTSFEDAIPALRSELALDRARRVIEAQAQDYDDELAGGATLEELSELTDLQLGQIGWTGQNDNDIAGFERFRRLAENVSANDYPAIEQLGDGGIVALRLDEILDPAPIPFEDVRENVASAWETNQRAKALLEQAESLIDTVKTGDFAAASLQANSEETLTRTSFGAELPADMLLRAFELAQGDVVALPGQDRAYLLRLDAVEAADPQDESLAQLRQVFSQQANNDVANDLFRALSSDIQTRAGVTLDQAAINAVHTNFH